MQTLDEIQSALMIIIRVGVSVRVIICLLRMMTDAEQFASNKKKLINVLVFLIIAENINPIKNLILSYFQ